MFVLNPAAAEVELEEAWVEGDDSARWRSTSGHGSGTGATASGSSLLEIAPERRLPRHTDSAEEAIVVITGTASVIVGDETDEVTEGGLALVPKDVPHEVRNAGPTPLRFLAVYASADVTTTYEQPVQPAGDRARASTA